MSNEQQSVTHHNIDESSTNLIINSTTYLYGNTLNQSTSMIDKDHVSQFDECDSEIFQCKIQKWLFYIMAPLLITVCIVGNSLGLAVMTRKNLRHTSMAALIGSLAVSDTVAVITGLSRHLVLKITKIDVRNLSVASCVIHRFVLYVALDTSAWILMIISFERFIAVCRPHLHTRFKSARRALISVAAAVVFQMLFNSSVFFVRGKQIIKDANNTKIINCGFPTKTAQEYWVFYHGWLSMSVYSIIPSLFMLVMNIFIVRQLVHIKAVRRQLSRNSRSSQRPKTTSMTVMLLSVTFYFMLITTPTFIFTMHQDKIFFRGKLTAESYARMELVDAVLTILLYLNHSTSFFLYCLSGKRFRKELTRCMTECFTSRTRDRISALSKAYPTETQIVKTSTDSK